MEILLYPEILIGVRWTFVDATTLLDYYGNPIFFNNNFFYPSFFNFFFEQGFNLYDKRIFRTGHFVLKNDYIYNQTGFIKNIQQFRANLWINPLIMDLKHYLNTTPINLDIAHIPNKSWGSLNSIAMYKKYISTLNFEFNSFFFWYNKDFFLIKEFVLNSNNFFFPIKIYYYLSNITLPYSLFQNFYFFFKAISFSWVFISGFFDLIFFYPWLPIKSFSEGLSLLFIGYKNIIYNSFVDDIKFILNLPFFFYNKMHIFFFPIKIFFQIFIRIPLNLIFLHFLIIYDKYLLMSFDNIIDMIIYNIYPKEITKTYMFLAIFNILNGYFFFSYIWIIVSFIPKFIIYCAVYEDFFIKFNFFKFLNSSFLEQLPFYIAFTARCFQIWGYYSYGYIELVLRILFDFQFFFKSVFKILYFGYYKLPYDYFLGRITLHEFKKEINNLKLIYLSSYVDALKYKMMYVLRFIFLPLNILSTGLIKYFDYRLGLPRMFWTKSTMAKFDWFFYKNPEYLIFEDVLNWYKNIFYYFYIWNVFSDFVYNSYVSFWDSMDMDERNKYLRENRVNLTLANYIWCLENQINDRFKIRYILYKHLMDADKFVFTDKLADEFWKDYQLYYIKGKVLRDLMIQRHAGWYKALQDLQWRTNGKKYDIGPRELRDQIVTWHLSELRGSTMHNYIPFDDQVTRVTRWERDKPKFSYLIPIPYRVNYYLYRVMYNIDPISYGLNAIQHAYSNTIDDNRMSTWYFYHNHETSKIYDVRLSANDINYKRFLIVKESEQWTFIDSFIIDLIFKNAEIMNMKDINPELRVVYEHYLNMKFDDHKKPVYPILHHDPTANHVNYYKTHNRELAEDYDREWLERNYENKMFAKIFYPIVKNTIFYVSSMYFLFGPTSVIKWDLFQKLFIDYGYPIFNYIGKKILNQMYLYKFVNPEDSNNYDFDFFYDFDFSYNFNFFYNKYVFYMLPIKKYIIYLLFLLHGITPIDYNKSFINLILFFFNKEFFINNKNIYKGDYISFLNLPFFFNKPFNFVDYLYREDWYLFSKYWFFKKVLNEENNIYIFNEFFNKSSININVINKLVYNDFYNYKPFSNYRIKMFYKNIILLDKFIYKENFLLNKFFFDIYFYEYFYKNIYISKSFIFFKKNNNIFFNFFLFLIILIYINILYNIFIIKNILSNYFFKYLNYFISFILYFFFKINYFILSIFIFFFEKTTLNFFIKQMGLHDLFYFCFNKILKSANNNYFYFILYEDLFKYNKFIFNINKNLFFYYSNFIFISKITSLYIFYFFYFFFNLFYNLYIYKFIYKLLFMRNKIRINKTYWVLLFWDNKFKQRWIYISYYLLFFFLIDFLIIFITKAHLIKLSRFIDLYVIFERVLKRSFFFQTINSYIEEKRFFINFLFKFRNKIYKLFVFIYKLHFISSFYLKRFRYWLLNIWYRKPKGVKRPWNSAEEFISPKLFFQKYELKGQINSYYRSLIQAVYSFYIILFLKLLLNVLNFFFYSYYNNILSLLQGKNYKKLIYKLNEKKLKFYHIFFFVKKKNEIIIKANLGITMEYLILDPLKNIITPFYLLYSSLYIMFYNNNIFSFFKIFFFYIIRVFFFFNNFLIIFLKTIYIINFIFFIFKYIQIFFIFIKKIFYFLFVFFNYITFNPYLKIFLQSFICYFIIFKFILHYNLNDMYVYIYHFIPLNNIIYDYIIYIYLFILEFFIYIIDYFFIIIFTIRSNFFFNVTFNLPFVALLENKFILFQLWEKNFSQLLAYNALLLDKIYIKNMMYDYLNNSTYSLPSKWISFFLQLIFQSYSFFFNFPLFFFTFMQNFISKNYNLNIFFDNFSTGIYFGIYFFIVYAYYLDDLTYIYIFFFQFFLGLYYLFFIYFFILFYLIKINYLLLNFIIICLQLFVNFYLKFITFILFIFIFFYWIFYYLYYKCYIYLLIDNLYIILYNFFFYNVFLNIFLFFYNIIYFYQIKIFSFLNIDINYIGQTIYDIRTDSINEKIIPARWFYYAFKIDENSNRTDYFDRDYYYYYILNDLKYLYFFKTFYNFPKEINNTFFFFFIIYSYFSFRVILFFFSFFNKWLHHIFKYDGGAFFTKASVLWKKFTYFKSSEFNYYFNNNFYVWNTLTHFNNFSYKVDRYIAKYNRENLIYADRLSQLKSHDYRFIKETTFTNADGKEKIIRDEVFSRHNNDFFFNNQENIAAYLFNTYYKKDKNFFKFQIISNLLFKNYNYYNNFFRDTYIQFMDDIRGANSFYLPFKLLWPKSLRHDYYNILIEPTNKTFTVNKDNYINRPGLLQKVIEDMENEEYQSYYVSSYYKFIMKQKNAYITNKFHRDDVHDEIYANKIKDIQLNYNIDILKESKNYLNMRLLEKLFIQWPNSLLLKYNYIYFPFLLNMISYKDILKEENKNLKYLFPFSIEQREKAYKDFFYKNYKELNKARILPLSDDWFLLLSDLPMLNLVTSYYLNSLMKFWDEFNYDSLWQNDLFYNQSFFNGIISSDYKINPIYKPHLKQFRDSFKYIESYELSYNLWLGIINNKFFKNTFNFNSRTPIMSYYPELYIEPYFDSLWRQNIKVTRERLLEDSYVPEDYMIDDMENPLTDEEWSYIIYDFSQRGLLYRDDGVFMSVTVMKDDLGFNKHNFLFIFVFFFVPFFTFLCTYEEDMINEDDIGYIVQYYYEDWHIEETFFNYVMDTYINMENNFIKMEYMFTIDLLDLIIDVSSFFSSFVRTFYTFNYNFYLPQLEMIYYNHNDWDDIDGDDYPEYMEESMPVMRYMEIQNTEENERFDDMYTYEDAEAYFITNFEDLLTLGPFFKRLTLPLIVNEISFNLWSYIVTHKWLEPILLYYDFIFISDIKVFNLWLNFLQKFEYIFFSTQENIFFFQEKNQFILTNFFFEYSKLYEKWNWFDFFLYDHKKFKNSYFTNFYWWDNKLDNFIDKKNKKNNIINTLYKLMDHKFFIHKQIKRKYILLKYIYFFQKNYFFEKVFFSKYLNLNENFKLNYFSYLNFDSKSYIFYDNFLKKKSFELFKDTYYARYNKWMKIDDDIKDYKFSLRHAFLDRYAIVVRNDSNYDPNNITITQKHDIIYFLRKSLNEKRSQLIFIRRMLKFYDSSFYMHGFFMHKKKEPDIYDHDLFFYMNSKFYSSINNYNNYNNYSSYYMHYYDITTMLNSYLFKYNKAGIRRYMNGIVRQLVYPFYFYSLPLFSYYKQLPFLASYFQKQQDVWIVYNDILLQNYIYWFYVDHKSIYLYIDKSWFFKNQDFFMAFNFLVKAYEWGRFSDGTYSCYYDLKVLLLYYSLLIFFFISFIFFIYLKLNLFNSFFDSALDNNGKDIKEINYNENENEDDSEIEKKNNEDEDEDEDEDEIEKFKNNNDEDEIEKFKNNNDEDEIEKFKNKIYSKFEGEFLLHNIELINGFIKKEKYKKKNDCFFNKKKKKSQIFVLEENIIQNNYNNYLFFDKDFIEFIKSYDENLYNSQEFQLFLNNSILKNLYYNNDFDIVIDRDFFYEQNKFLNFIKINYSELYNNIIFENFLYRNSINLDKFNYNNSQFYFKKVDDKWIENFF